MGPTDRFTTEHAAELYGLERWGNGYFSVGEDGHLRVNPDRDPARFIDLAATVGKLVQQGHRTPLLLRFPQLLQSQVEQLTGAFRQAIDEFHYPATFHPVFPFKVNQQRQVTAALLRSGWDRSLGLEVGSIPELVASLVLPIPDDAVLICNGFKDDSYMSTAAMAARLGKNVIIVLEKPFELETYLQMARREKVVPPVGIRIRLQSRGSGMWEKSGGSASKFGFTTAELLHAIGRFKEAGLMSSLKLLHFHIGSQLTEIRKLKQAVREGTRVYARLVQQGVELAYLDVGGGLGIDYDGSKTSSDASMNYTVQEYANDVVYGIWEVCEHEKVAPPKIICESGRMLTAYHSVLVADARGTTSDFGTNGAPETASPPQVVLDLIHTAEEISVKNYREYYHDALAYRDELQNLFNLGMLSLEDRARGEGLFWQIAHKAVRYSRTARFVAEEFLELDSKLHEKYICNFSVFQSIPDTWALDQLFPIVPIHRLNERPSRRASLVDITCDSDGEVEKFVDLKDVKESLEVHELVPGQPYWLGFMLIGAYQDAIGDLHNMFGRVHEADVLVDAGGKTTIREVRAGQTAADTMAAFGFTPEFLRDGLESALGEQLKGGDMSEADAQEIRAAFRQRLDSYTYLD